MDNQPCVPGCCNPSSVYYKYPQPPFIIPSDPSTNTNSPADNYYTAEWYNTQHGPAVTWLTLQDVDIDSVRCPITEASTASVWACIRNRHVHFCEHGWTTSVSFARRHDKATVTGCINHLVWSQRPWRRAIVQGTVPLQVKPVIHFTRQVQRTTGVDVDRLHLRPCYLYPSPTYTQHSHLYPDPNLHT